MQWKARTKPTAPTLSKPLPAGCGKESFSQYSIMFNRVSLFLPILLSCVRQIQTDFTMFFTVYGTFSQRFELLDRGRCGTVTYRHLPPIAAWLFHRPAGATRLRGHPAPLAKVSPHQPAPPWPGLVELENEHVVLDLVVARFAET